jgi:very-short-patch-repair endonuclease
MENKYKERTFICKGCNQEVTLRRPENKLHYCSRICYEKSKRQHIRKGKTINCVWCNKKVYKSKCFLSKHKHLFCSLLCANKYQKRNKLKFICKTCNKTFYWSKSRITQANPKYCSIKCRNKDTNHMITCGLNSTIIQQNNKGLNKLELGGRKILKKIGLQFEEQVLMFDKFLVDVLIKDKKIIIQWDGYYWHSKIKRELLDKSQDAYLKKCGYKVIRITDKQIKENEVEVYDYIKRTVL